MKKQFISFEDAKREVKCEGLKSSDEWKSYSSTKRPSYIPSNPHKIYSEWKGYPDWMGYDFDRAEHAKSASRRYRVNNGFFKEWSIDMAYVFGLWCADGCILGNRFIITQCEYGILDKISEAMESTYPVRGMEGRFDINVSSADIATDIKRMGGKERKSLDMKMPIVPRLFFSHFLRGYFDGDGSISFCNGRLSSVICGSSSSIMNPLFESIKSNVEGVRGRIYLKKYKTKNGDGQIYRIQYSHNDTVRICRYMYQDNPYLKLDRKFNKFSDNNFMVETRKDFLPYKKAKILASNMNCSTRRIYFERIRREPIDRVPTRPDLVYKNKGWNNWREWLHGN